MAKKDQECSVTLTLEYPATQGKIDHAIYQAIHYGMLIAACASVWKDLRRLADGKWEWRGCNITVTPKGRRLVLTITRLAAQRYAVDIGTAELFAKETLGQAIKSHLQQPTVMWAVAA